MQSLWMVVSALFFAFYAVFIKLVSLEGVTSFEVLFYRSIFGVVVFLIIMQIKGIGIHTKYPSEHAIRSLVGTCAILAGIYSISHLNLGLAMTLNYTSPLFLGCFAIAAALQAHRAIHWKLLSTLLLGFAGVVVMLSPTISPDEYSAALVGLSAGFCTSVAVSYVKRLGIHKEPEERILFYFVLAGAVVGLIGALFGPGFTLPSATVLAQIIGFCVCATLAQMTLTRAFSRGNVVLSGALQYTVILFSTIMGEIIFMEPVTPAIICGMVMIVATGIGASFFTRQEIQRHKAEECARKARAQEAILSRGKK